MSGEELHHKFVSEEGAFTLAYGCLSSLVWSPGTCADRTAIQRDPARSSAISSDLERLAAM